MPPENRSLAKRSINFAGLAHASVNPYSWYVTAFHLALSRLRAAAGDVLMAKQSAQTCREMGAQHRFGLLEIDAMLQLATFDGKRPEPEVKDKIEQTGYQRAARTFSRSGGLKSRGYTVAHHELGNPKKWKLRVKRECSSGREGPFRSSRQVSMARRKRAKQSEYLLVRQRFLTSFQMRSMRLRLGL